MKFSILDIWPNQITAEGEYAKRLQIAAIELGHKVRIVTKSEILKILKAEYRSELGEFLIIPHFSEGRFIDHPTVGMTWNAPTVVMWHSHGVANQLSVDLLLSGGSSKVDAFFNKFSIYSGLELNSKLSPTVSNQSTPQPSSKINKFFYSGVNWERIYGGATRHDGFLETIDRNDLADFFGARKVKGIFTWQGFQNYRGEIQSDGTSHSIEASNYQCSLVLFSNSHKSWDLISNRLSENLIARNYIVCDDHPRLRKYEEFLTLIPSDIDIPKKIELLKKTLKWVNENPKIAADKVLRLTEAWFVDEDLKTQIQELMYQVETILPSQIVSSTTRVATLDYSDLNFMDNLIRLILDEQVDFIFDSRTPRNYGYRKLNRAMSSLGDFSYVAFSGISDVNKLVLGIDLSQNHSELSFNLDLIMINLNEIKNHIAEVGQLSRTEFFTKLICGHFGKGAISPISIGYAGLPPEVLKLKTNYKGSSALIGKIDQYFYESAFERANDKTWQNTFTNKRFFVLIWIKLPKRIKNLIKNI